MITNIFKNLKQNHTVALLAMLMSLAVASDKVGTPSCGWNSFGTKFQTELQQPDDFVWLTIDLCNYIASAKKTCCCFSGAQESLDRVGSSVLLIPAFCCRSLWPNQGGRFGPSQLAVGHDRSVCADPRFSPEHADSVRQRCQVTPLDPIPHSGSDSKSDGHHDQSHQHLGLDGDVVQ